MKKRLIKILGAILVLAGIGTAMVTPVYADDVFCDQEGLSATVKESMGCSSTEAALPETIKNILNFVVGVGGLVAVIYVVIGGYGYMTSQGDSAKLQKAKSTILYAVIGLVICSLAFVIVNFALGSLNSTTSSETTETTTTETTETTE